MENTAVAIPNSVPDIDDNDVLEDLDQGFHRHQITSDDGHNNAAPRHLPLSDGDDEDIDLLDASKFQRHRLLRFRDEVDTVPPSVAGIRGTGLPSLTYFSHEPTEPTESSIATDEPSVVEDLGESMYNKSSMVERIPKATSLPDSCDGSASSIEIQLSHAISDTARHLSENKGFVPKRLLAEIMNEESVRLELGMIEKSFKERISCWQSPRSSGSIEERARIICACDPPEEIFSTRHQRTETRSFRKIFAILLLIGKRKVIHAFIDEDVSDLDLPLRLIRRPTNSHSPSLCRKDGPNTGLTCTQGWRPAELDRFAECQWKMLVPFFTQGICKTVKDFRLQPKVILPFIHTEYAASGAHGTVYKVKIHPEHHDFINRRDVSEFFAVKTLDCTEEDFRQEVGMLKRLSSTHCHLISLLVTYRHRDRFHLIFPWADCNLRTYWERKNPRPTHDSATLVWVARQCKGIADGLGGIHLHFTNSISTLLGAQSPSMGERMTPSSPLPPRLPSPAGPLAQGHRLVHARPFPPNGIPQRILFGRHCDIKATNLLWFPGPSGSSSKGIIKISDCGGGEFNTTGPAIWGGGSSTHSPAYRPPECDLPDLVTNNHSYDIWSLGCLYLEFITWYIGGWQLLVEFEELRAVTSHGNQDYTKGFFDVVDSRDQQWYAQEAIVKPAVLQFMDRLRQDHNCSDLLKKFLDLIQTRMLIMKQMIGIHRITCVMLVRDLGEMIEEYEESKGIAFETADPDTSERP